MSNTLTIENQIGTKNTTGHYVFNGLLVGFWRDHKIIDADEFQEGDQIVVYLGPPTEILIERGRQLVGQLKERYNTEVGLV